MRRSRGKEGGGEGRRVYLMESGSRGWLALVLANPAFPGAAFSMSGGCLGGREGRREEEEEEGGGGRGGRGGGRGRGRGRGRK